MRAAVLRGGAIEVRETADPSPGPGQLLVRTLACGICASDIHFMDHPEGDPDDDTGLSNHDQDADIVMGHEYCAEIVEYGPGTERRWPLGTRVSSLPVLLGDDGPRVIGLAPISSLTRLGVGPIVAADFVASRREAALAMGAHVVIDPALVSPYTAWREVAYGSPDAVRDIMGLLDLPGCVVFECVGVPGVLDAIVKGCERSTRIFSAGGPPEGEHLHTMTAKRKGLNMQFGGGPSMTHWNEAFDEVTSGRLDVTPMTGRIVGLDDVPAAIDDARRADGPARIIVVPR